MRTDGVVVPESKKRKAAGSTRRPADSPKTVQKKGPSPRWLAPLMLVLFGVGILWLVVYYLTEGRMAGLPGVGEIGNWNLLVGFAFIIAGFVLATQWR